MPFDHHIFKLSVQLTPHARMDIVEHRTSHTFHIVDEERIQCVWVSADRVAREEHGEVGQARSGSVGERQRTLASHEVAVFRDLHVRQ